MLQIKKNIGQVILHILLVALIFIMLYPLFMALWNAFKSEMTYDATRWYPTLPLRIKNVQVAFKAVWIFIVNTIFVAAVGVGGSLLVASLASYAFSRIEFPGRKFIYAAVLALLMVPGVLTLVPSYMLYRSLGIYNNHLVLIIPLVTGGSVFGVFLLNTFFSGLPKDLFEAAQIDGAGDLKCYLRIAVPLCMPILGTLAIMQLTGVWNDFIWPMITIQDTKLLTISSGLLISFTQQYSANMPVTFAGYLVSAVPLIFLFVFANKYYIEGLVGSAIKM